MKKFKSILTSCTLLLQLLFIPSVFSKENPENNSEKSNYNIKELVFPSEVKRLPKAAGSIYYNSSVKDKVLIPVHFWGEISKSGLHFIPVDTNLIQGISMAGGPRAAADLSELTLTRSIKNKLVVTKYDLGEGGNVKTHQLSLKPGDTIFLKKSTFESNRAYYTSLIGVFATVLSTILLMRQVRSD